MATQDVSKRAPQLERTSELIDDLFSHKQRLALRHHQTYPWAEPRVSMTIGVPAQAGNALMGVNRQRHSVPRFTTSAEKISK